MSRKIEISHKTIIFTVLFLIGLWFLYTISDIVLQLFVALLIMLVLNPTVTKLEKSHIPRAASVLIVYACVIALIVFTLAGMVPLLVEQTASFANAIPKYLADLHVPAFVIDETTKELTSQLGKLPTQILSITVAVFSNILAIVSVFLFGLYFSLARKDLTKQIDPYVAQHHIEMLDRIMAKLEVRLGGWARGQFLLMFIVGLANFVGFTVLGIPYALPLSILAGILEAVPNLGPIIAALPATIVGFSVSPVTGMAVIALAFLVQQVESYVLVPKIMQKSAGVNPIISLLALIIGFKIAGVVGAVLSIPIVLTAMVFLQELYPTHKD